jgi:hypothetical protein|tara:strand:+ start:6202 stop:6648 length:447 start_codon:yes stop_codon:yes gene_type:complete
MSILNKLLGMLDELKEENPEFANKALLAAETLKAGVDPEELEDWENDSEEEIEEEEVFDDTYVIVSAEDTQRFFNNKEKLDSELLDYGLYMRDHEVKKTLMLEQIEQVRGRNEQFLQNLRENYRLDPTSAYSMEIDNAGSGNLAFVKE